MIHRHNGHEIEIYDSITKLPVTRHQEYNLNALIDAGVGSTLESIADRHRTLSRLINTDPALAQKELANMMQAIRFVVSRSSPEMNSFVCITKSIDGKPVLEEDLTEDGIRKVIQQLGRIRFPYYLLKDILKAVKKKLIESSKYFSPTWLIARLKKSFIPD